jgi:pyruvate dehydrogenase E1 component
VPLGTDGFGLSDTRTALRRHFEVDAPHIVIAVLWGLFAEGAIKAERVLDAARSYGIDSEAPDPHDT